MQHVGHLVDERLWNGVLLIPRAQLLLHLGLLEHLDAFAVGVAGSVIGKPTVGHVHRRAVIGFLHIRRVPRLLELRMEALVISVVEPFKLLMLSYRLKHGLVDRARLLDGHVIGF